MEIKDIRKKDKKELHKILAEQRNKLREVRFSVASKQHKNFNEINDLKTDIAQILTVLREKDFIQESSAKKD